MIFSCRNIHHFLKLGNRKFQEVLGNVIQAIKFCHLKEGIAFLEDIQGEKFHALFKPSSQKWTIDLWFNIIC